MGNQLAFLMLKNCKFAKNYTSYFKIKMTNFLKIIFGFSLVSILVSCNTDDDICTDGEGTPRAKIKFKTYTTGKLKTLDSLYLAVDYGNGPVNLVQRANVDSVLIPLRVDDFPYTEISVKTSKLGSTSRIRIHYAIKSEYVSPACGVKRLYESVNSTLETANPVEAVSQEQNQIHNENKTHLYLLF